jgi:hypothetical protein
VFCVLLKRVLSGCRHWWMTAYVGLRLQVSAQEPLSCWTLLDSHASCQSTNADSDCNQPAHQRIVHVDASADNGAGHPAGKAPVPWHFAGTPAYYSHSLRRACATLARAGSPAYSTTMATDLNKPELGRELNDCAEADCAEAGCSKYCPNGGKRFTVDSTAVDERAWGQGSYGKWFPKPQGNLVAIDDRGYVVVRA